MIICKLENITKKYRDKIVLDKFNLEIKAGEFVAILGKSGSGKSTLLNILGLGDKVDTGKISLFGKVVDKKNRIFFLRYKISYIFQNFALIENETIEENLAIALVYSRMTKKKKRALMKDALKMVDLEEKSLLQKVYGLSGGEQQRIALARALLKPSEIILADEPTGSLDSENRNAVLKIMKKLNEDGKTIVLVTHDEEVASFCSRKILI